jgi:hypothetical protein
MVDELLFCRLEIKINWDFGLWFEIERLFYYKKLDVLSQV